LAGKEKELRVYDENSILGRLRARGEEFFQQASAELMKNPQFVSAMQAAVWGKEKIDEAVAQALTTLNIPTRTEFKRALERIEALERQVQVRNRKRAKRAENAAKMAAATQRAARRKTRRSRPA
jgi:polyhydroxyalkanoate synthesis regulator phasin